MQGKKPDIVLLQVTTLKYLTLRSRFQSAAEQVETYLGNLGEASTNVELIIADSLYGCGKHDWDETEHKWGPENFNDVFEFAIKFGKVRSTPEIRTIMNRI